MILGLVMLHIFDHAFMRNAFVAGTAVALAAGLVGYFVVLRSEVFTGDALSHVAFTGALAALVIGIDARVGLFAATIGVGALIGLLSLRGRADDVVIGNVFSWILGIGVLLLTIYTRTRSASGGEAGVSVLFGSIFGLSAGQARFAAAVAVVVVAVVLSIGRPLLFTSVDQAVAAGRGVPVRALTVGFLALAGVVAAEATQAVGALLLLGLLAAPAGAALRLTARPYRALWLSAVIAIASMWAGLTVSYLVPRVPPSTAILGVAAACFALAHVKTLKPSR
jgi:zinc/manganese transport system permease protein